MRVRAGHRTGLLYDTKRANRGNIANRAFASIAVNNAASGDVKAPQPTPASPRPWAAKASASKTPTTSPPPWQPARPNPSGPRC